MTVWLVWRTEHQYRALVAICKDIETAEDEVDKQVKWFERYHGPRYPTLFDQKLGDSYITTNWGERIEWEEREVV